GLDGRGNGTLDEDGEDLAEFSSRTGTLCAEREDFFKLIEDEVGDPILAFALVKMKPEAARRVVGQLAAWHIDRSQRFEGDKELFEGEIFAFAVADTIEGRAKAEIHQVGHQPGAQQTGFPQPAASVDDEQGIEPQLLEEFGGLSFASEK